MRSFRHWTPMYIVDRLGEIAYQKTHSDHPWLTKTANSILSSYLKISDVGVEWGSGKSTVFFSRRVSMLTSIEHDPLWYANVSKILKESGITNVEYLLIEKDQEQEDEDRGRESRYVQVVKKFSKNSLDFALVDGIYRGACAIAILEKIRPGGILILDNANRYLPSKSVSPCSRSFAQGPTSSEWSEFLTRVKHYRCIWTSSGVTDTAIYLTPCQNFQY